MFPVGDDNSLRRSTPYVTYILIVINVLVFLLELQNGDEFIREWAFVPGRFSDHPGANVATIFSAMFMHGGWLHLGGNMLYLWIFGDNVEDRLGHGRYLVFYLLCGAFAALAQTYVNPGSSVPMIGASGAISGVLGAYIVLFPHSRVLTIVPIVFFIQLLEVPAIVLLGLWFLMQLLSGVGSLGERADIGGVAFWAHVAGFLAGLGFVYVFKQPEREKVEWWDGVR